MIIGLIALLTALALSAVSAYYSIVGLVAIFSAAVMPIIIMGGTLETAKIVTTLWLHYNWERSPWKIKSYLAAAVVVLMFITSMGTFGFLSKSHADQSMSTGDVESRVALFDEKIKTQRDNIDAHRKALVQMDAAVDQLMARTDTEQGASKSSNLRTSQKKERTRLQSEIDTAQKEITKLQEQRAPIASELRKVIADVGPIRYIAALVYGDNKADENMLEAAVRWVIIIIVAVFDPLAIMLLLAATTSIDWAKFDRTRSAHDKVTKERDELEHENELKLNEGYFQQRLDEEKNKINQLVFNTLEDDQTKIKELTVKVTDQQEMLDAYAVKIQEAEKEVDDAEQFASSVIKLYEDTEKNKAETSEMVKDITRDIYEMSEALAEDNAKMLAYKQELTEITEQYTETAQRNSELADTVSSMAEQYDVIEAARAALEADLNSERQVTEELVETVGEVTEQVDKLTAELEYLSQHPQIVEVPVEVEKIVEVERVVEVPVEVRVEVPIEVERIVEVEVEKLVEVRVEVPVEVEKVVEVEKLVEVRVEVPVEVEKLVEVPVDRIVEVEKLVEVRVEVPVEVEKVVEVEKLVEVRVEVPVDRIVEVEKLVEVRVEVPVDRIVEVEKIVERIVEVPVYRDPPPAPTFEDDLVAAIAEPVAEPKPASIMPSSGKMPPRKKAPRTSAVPDNFPMGGSASFGTRFPENPFKGDLFLRVDYMPSKLFKWIGSRWIEMDKAMSDNYIFDQEYIKHLVEKVNTGEYDVDDLSDSERTQMADYLRNNP